VRESANVCIQLLMVTSGHAAKIVVSPFDPPYPKNPCCTRNVTALCFRNGIIAAGRFTLRE